MEEFSSLCEKGKRDDAFTLAIHAGSHNLEFFTLLFFSHYTEYDFNKFHHKLFETYQYGERGVRRADGAPRGYAKSTYKTVIKPLHDLCYGLETFIVVISDTEKQSLQKLKDVREEILSNDLLKDIFGVHFKAKKVGAQQFTAYSKSGSCHFMAYSRGASIRGIRHGKSRPSKVLLDDVENPKEVHNEMLREKDRSWYFEDVTKVGNKKTNIEFIGTVLHNDSLLKTLLKNPAYESNLHAAIVSWSKNQGLWTQWDDIYNNIDDPKRLVKSDQFFKDNQKAMLEGTEVLWPDYEPYYELMKERAEIGHRAFMKEKMNAPVGSDDLVFDEIWWYREESDGLRIEKTDHLISWDDLKHNCFGALDPAAGQEAKRGKSKKSDYSCLLTGYKHLSGRVFVHDDWTKRVSPTKFINQIFDLHDTVQFNKFGVETNLFRDLLLNNLREERKAREAKSGKIIDLKFVDIYQTEKKEERIFRLEPKVSRGHIVFNRALSQVFKNQLEGFPNEEHDDGPDCLEMLWNLAHNRYKVGGVKIDRSR